ncbi:hypothetical protein SH2C18_25430 [Clostridium sediminicola]|uniref:hypothetical protein n=1 Tax=Clostridium sediminicola TaxID=3114879 RepID=UPI0031F2323A
MYKEIVIRRKIVSLVSIIFIITFSIVISDLVINIKLFGYSIGEYTSILIFVFMILIMFKEITKCMLKYKYSIIADQFIVYKMNGDKQEIKENIKIKDIISIDKLNSKKFNLSNFIGRKYTSVTITSKIYCCTYKSNYKIQKFYFEPSSYLVTRLNTLKNE